jgi:hypothetical protein
MLKLTFKKYYFFLRLSLKENDEDNIKNKINRILFFKYMNAIYLLIEFKLNKI